MEERRTDLHGDFVKDTSDQDSVKDLCIGHLLGRNALHVNAIVKAARMDQASRRFQPTDLDDIKPHKGGGGVVRGQLKQHEPRSTPDIEDSATMVQCLVQGWHTKLHPLDP